MSTDSDERRWRAMGAAAHLIVVGGPTGLADRAMARIETLESRWSRFRPMSEICRLNAADGAAVAVSTDTLELVERAVDAWRLTGGGFDPLLLGALEAAGYDRSFERLAHPSSGLHRPTRPVAPLVGCTDIVIDRRRRTVALPPGTAFDPGGIGKGLAADLVVAEMLSAGAAGVCVNLGGDLRVAGDSGTDGDWTVGIDVPGYAEPLATLGLSAGAVATSTTLIRRWTVAGESAHHLIDPSTGRPSTSDLVLATVLTARAWEAEVLAKALLLRGAERAFDLLSPGLHEALTVDREGTVRRSDGVDAFTGAPPLDKVPSYL